MSKQKLQVQNKISLIIGMLLFTSILLIINSAQISVAGYGQSEYTIYVSPKGYDTASGSLTDPIFRLEHAAELAREKAGKVPVTIYLSDGNYHLTEPLKLGLKDSGKENAPIHWKAVPGEKPVINGGISVRNWKQEDDGSWSAMLPQNFNGEFRSFYVNDRRAVRARFPDKDYLRIHESGNDNRTNFFFNENEIPKVKDILALELVFVHDWSITRIGVKSIDWRSNRLFAVDSIGARLNFFHITGWEEHPRYFLENAGEFCDSPGEWYCDFSERKIYYRPLPTDDINKTEAVIPLASKLVTISGSKDVRAGFIDFNSITFAHTSWKLPEKGYCGVQACMFANRSKKSSEGREVITAAVELDFVKNITFKNCTIKHTGGSGIWIRENSFRCEISDCHIYDISGNGVSIGEGQDRLVAGIPWWKTAPEEVSKNNKVVHSLIEDCGKQFFGAVGIWCGLVAQTVIDHNEIRNLPYTGISLGWMWDTTATPCETNIINGNHIHHVMKTLSDGGGIYTLGQQPGSRISDNVIHDVKANAGKAESNGMFLDQGTKDFVIENNIVFNIARSPLRFHLAKTNLVRKNVLVCSSNTPPIRYNNTQEVNIKKVENLVLIQSSELDVSHHWPGLEGLNEHNVFIHEAKVQFNSQQKHTQLRYTIDGAEPTQSSSLYTKPFKIKESTSFKIKEFAGNGMSSPVYEAHFVKEKHREPVNLNTKNKGLYFEYYEFSKLIQSVTELHKFEPTKRGTVGKFVYPYENLPAQFGLIFKGYIDVSDDAVYRFSVTSNDGSRLYIADKLVVNNDGLHGANEKEGEIALKAGLHKIELLYFQAGGGKALKVSMKRRGSKKVEISESVLFY